MMMIRQTTVAAAAVMIGLGSWATANEMTTITGAARVVDADTVVVGKVTVRLKGVDAAELGTEIGGKAKHAMIAIVNGGPLTCALTGEKTWRREVGTCVTPSGVNINLEIIRQGWALACPRYDARYLPYEQSELLKIQGRASYCVR